MVVVDSISLCIASVSLFTREWIEIKIVSNKYPKALVSLFTREWIEIQLNKSNRCLCLSPSLRGSGLKCLPL